MRKHKKRCRYRVLAVILFACTQNTACSGPAAPTCGGQGCPPCKLYCIIEDWPGDDAVCWESYFHPIFVPGKGWSCCGFSRPPCDDYLFDHWFGRFGCEKDERTKLEQMFCAVTLYECSFIPTHCDGRCNTSCYREGEQLTGPEFEEYFERCILPKCEKYVEPDLL